MTIRLIQEIKSLAKGVSLKIAKIYYLIRRGLIYLENDPFIKAIAFTLLVVTLVHIFIDLQDRKEERKFRSEERAARTEERINRSWQDLLNQFSSHTIKVNALNYLFERKVSFRGVDLSCESLGGGWNEKKLTCKRPVILEGLKLDSVNSNGWYISDKTDKDPVVRESTWLTGCLARDGKEDSYTSYRRERVIPPENDVFRNKLLEERKRIREGGADFEDARLSGIVFRNSRLSGANFSGADLRGAKFFRTAVEAGNFMDADISGAVFEESLLLGTEFVYSIGGIRVNETNFSQMHRPKSDDIPVRPSFFRNWLEGCLFSSFVYKITFFENNMKNCEIGLSFDQPLDHLQSYCHRIYGQENDEMVKECVMWASTSNGIEYSDLTCSVLGRDNKIKLTGSNISSTRFPKRYLADKKYFTRPGERQFVESEKVPIYVHDPGSLGGFRVSWGDNYSPPWFFHDSPPVNSLDGEKVIECQDRNSDYLERVAGGRIPDECDITDRRTAKWAEFEPLLTTTEYDDQVNKDASR